MRLNEILDPSDYRSGDESDPRSPYYDGQEPDPSADEYNTTFTTYVYEEDGTERTVQISGVVAVTTYYSDYIPRGRHGGSGGDSQGIEVESVRIKQVAVDGKPMPVDQFLQQYGTSLSEFNSEHAEEAIKGTGDQYLMKSSWNTDNKDHKTNFVPM
jgi:hypothetical protein